MLYATKEYHAALRSVYSTACANTSSQPIGAAKNAHRQVEILLEKELKIVERALQMAEHTRS